MNNWLSRPAAALALILGFCVVSVFFLYSPFTGIRPGDGETFTVVQRHYGVDAAEMERKAAVPLEDALSRIHGVKKIRSVSENGTARVFANFEGKTPGRYEAVREAAQEIYKTLSSSAQRPEILGSGDSRLPMWTAAVFGFSENPRRKGAELGTLLERSVKPALEALPGAGEVELSGAAVTEIIIVIDEQKAASLGLDPRRIASTLAYNDALFSGGRLLDGGREISIAVDGRYGDPQSLGRALVPVGNGKSRFITLEEIASIREEEKESHSRSRLNGKETAVIAVTAGSGANPGKLSVLIQKELEKQGLEFTVLSDRGAEEKAAYRSVLGAALQGSAAVAVIAALLCRRKNRALLFPAAALSVPVIILFSAALLRALGFEPDKLVLAGLSSGAGAAVDAVILSAEYLGTVRRAESRRAFEALRFPLVSGAATTIIALLPLILRKPVSSFHSVAWAVGAVNFVSMVLALTLLPPLFLYHTAEKKAARPDSLPPKTFFAFLSRFLRKLRKKRKTYSDRLKFGLSRQPVRVLAFYSRLCVRRAGVIAVFWLIITALGAAALFLKGADTGVEGAETSVYAQIEFKGGLHVEETDRILAAWAESLKGDGIINIQTSARTGSGSVLLSFDPACLNREEAKTLLRSHSIPGGFVYIGESSGSERIWEIRISGDDEKRCRELASEAARLCGRLPAVEETVLNFKEGRPRLTLKADRERFAASSVSFSGAAGTVRYGVHGPVTYKRVNSLGETDVRIRWGSPRSAEEIRRSLVPVVSSPAAAMEAGSLFRENMDSEPSSIQRLDRRRSASISVRTKVMDPRKARKKIMDALSALSPPPGYGVEFDPGAIKAAGEVGTSGFLFILALAFCYMVIAASKESLLLPLAVLAAVPPSLAVPALCTAGVPLNAAASAAFVAAAGMAVNAAVLTADSVAATAGRFSGRALYRTLRKRLPVLAATTLTTVAGAAPFLFVSGASVSLVKSLSLVTTLGVAASALCSVSLIPALAALFPKLFAVFPLSDASSKPLKDALFTPDREKTFRPHDKGFDQDV
jgi:multidrug efflux pump subunit AcrB